MLQWARANGCPRDEKALCVAAEHGQEVVVQALFNLGADFNKATDDGWTPLGIAAHKGHQAVVRALIEAGADINKATDDGATPLFIAAKNGHEAIVQILRDARDA